MVRRFALPYALGFGVILAGYLIATLLQDFSATLWVFGLSFLGLPLMVGYLEYAQRPEGRWWLSSLIAALVSLAILVSFSIYAVSRI